MNLVSDTLRWYGHVHIANEDVLQPDDEVFILQLKPRGEGEYSISVDFFVDATALDLCVDKNLHVSMVGGELNGVNLGNTTITAPVSTTILDVRVGTRDDDSLAVEERQKMLDVHMELNKDQQFVKPALKPSVDDKQGVTGNEMHKMIDTEDHDGCSLGLNFCKSVTLRVWERVSIGPGGDENQEWKPWLGTNANFAQPFEWKEVATHGRQFVGPHSVDDNVGRSSHFYLKPGRCYYMQAKVELPYRTPNGKLVWDWDRTMTPYLQVASRVLHVHGTKRADGHSPTDAHARHAIVTHGGRPEQLDGEPADFEQDSEELEGWMQKWKAQARCEFEQVQYEHALNIGVGTEHAPVLVADSIDPGIPGHDGERTSALVVPPEQFGPYVGALIPINHEGINALYWTFAWRKRLGTAAFRFEANLQDIEDRIPNTTSTVSTSTLPAAITHTTTRAAANQSSNAGNSTRDTNGRLPGELVSQNKRRVQYAAAAGSMAGMVIIAAAVAVKRRYFSETRKPRTSRYVTVADHSEMLLNNPGFDWKFL